MKMRGYTEEEIKDITTDILSNGCLYATLKLTLDKKIDFKKSIEVVDKIGDEIKELIAKGELDIKDYSPKNTCENCIGCCGKRLEMLKDGLFNCDTKTFAGADCTRHQTCEQFHENNFDKIEIVFEKTDERGVKEIVAFKRYESILLKETSEVIEKNGYVKSFNSTKVVTFSFDLESVSKDFMMKGYNLSSMKEQTSSFYIGSYRPKDNETFEEYFKRARKEDSEKAKKEVEAAYMIPYKKALEMLSDKLTNSEKEIVKIIGIAEYVKTYLRTDVWTALRNR